MYKFKHTHQYRGRNSNYQIIQKKEMDQQNADRVQLDRILLGVRPNGSIILKFLLRGSRNTPPTYPELVKEVRGRSFVGGEKSRFHHQAKTSAQE